MTRLKKIVMSIIIIFISIFCLSGIKSVKADSGFDSSYDSGGSSGSSDWGGSDWGGSDRSSHGDSGITLPHRNCTTEACKKSDRAGLILLGFLIGVPILIIIIRSVYVAGLEEEKQIKKLKEIDSNLDKDKLLEHAYSIFYEVQMGWMEFDYAKLKELLSDELYNTYQMDLEALKIKNQKNIMKAFELIGYNLRSLNEVNGKYVAQIDLEVKFIDYIEDISTHKILRGNAKRKLDNTYLLTFEKTKEVKNNMCPNCGAPTEGNATGVCEYCKSKLVFDTHDWILTKKEIISQK